MVKKQFTRQSTRERMSFGKRKSSSHSSGLARGASGIIRTSHMKKGSKLLGNSALNRFRNAVNRTMTKEKLVEDEEVPASAMSRFRSAVNRTMRTS